MTSNSSFDISEHDVELLFQTQATIVVSCAQDPNLAYMVSKTLDARHFQDESLRSLWQYISVKLEANQANDINLTTLQLDAQRKNLEIDLTKYLDLAVEDEEIVGSYARKIKEIWLRNHLRDGMNNVHVEELPVTDVIEKIKGLVNDVENDLTDISMSKTLPELFDDLELYLNSDEIPTIYRFGIPEIDSGIVDFAPGNTVIIGATPGGGKTSMGIFMAIQNGWMGIPTHFFSLEMSERQITARFLNALTGISAKKILRKTLSKEEMRALKAARKTLERLPIRVTPYADMPLNVLLQSMRDSKIRFGTEVFFVDYVQLISYAGRTKREEASFVAQKLKSAALELDACIVQMSQLSRNNKVEPDMYDLKETSDLEQAASLIVLLHTDKTGYTDSLKTQESYPVFFKVAKQRNDAVFRKLINFIPARMQFTYLDYDLSGYDASAVKSKKKDDDE